MPRQESAGKGPLQVEPATRAVEIEHLGPPARRHRLRSRRHAVTAFVPAGWAIAGTTGDPPPTASPVAGGVLLTVERFLHASQVFDLTVTVRPD